MTEPVAGFVDPDARLPQDPQPADTAAHYPGSPLICPECGATSSKSSTKPFTNRALAAHRKAAHGVSAEAAAEPVRSVAEELAEIEGGVTLFLQLAAMGWKLRDPICGEALEVQAPQIGTALLLLAKENSRVRRYLLGAAGSSGWIGLGIMAVWPVAMTVYAHHVAPRVPAAPQQLYAVPQAPPPPPGPPNEVLTDPLLAEAVRRLAESDEHDRT